MISAKSCLLVSHINRILQNFLFTQVFPSQLFDFLLLKEKNQIVQI